MKKRCLYSLQAKFASGKEGDYLADSDQYMKELESRNLKKVKGFNNNDELFIEDWIDGDDYELKQCSPFEALKMKLIGDENEELFIAIVEVEGLGEAKIALENDFEDYSFFPEWRPGRRQRR